MIEDAFVTLGLLFTAYLVWEFQEGWVGNEYRSTTFLKLNKEKTTLVFGLAFLGSLAVFTGTVLTGLGKQVLRGYAFDTALLLYMLFFFLLNGLAGGGRPWRR
ncbi:MAG: hypothetical protein ABEJ87_03700 [Candidatus Nanohalobium sp.]